MTTLKNAPASSIGQIVEHARRGAAGRGGDDHHDGGIGEQFHAGRRGRQPVRDGLKPDRSGVRIRPDRPALPAFEHADPDGQEPGGLT